MADWYGKLLAAEDKRRQCLRTNGYTCNICGNHFDKGQFKPGYKGGPGRGNKRDRYKWVDDPAEFSKTENGNFGGWKWIILIR